MLVSLSHPHTHIHKLCYQWSAGSLKPKLLPLDLMTFPRRNPVIADKGQPFIVDKSILSIYDLNEVHDIRTKVVMIYFVITVFNSYIFIAAFDV